MSKITGNFSWRTLRSYLLPALVIILGLQTLRQFVSTLAWYLRDTVGAGPATLGAYAFGAFAVAFLAAGLRRAAGARGALWITAGGLALLRFAEQAVFNPPIDLWLSLGGSALFVLFLPIFVAHLRTQEGSSAAARLGYGLILGLGFDSALHGITRTLDLSAIRGPLPFLVVGILSILVIWLLIEERFRPAPGATESSAGGALAMLAIGPYLLLQALVFQNQGWISAVAGLSAPLAFFFIIAGSVLAALGALWGFSRPHTLTPWMGLAAAVYLGLAGFTADRSQGLLISVLLSQFLGGWSLALLATITTNGKRRGLGMTTLFSGLGMLIFLILAFVYYVSLDLALPIPRTAILPAAAIIFGLLVLNASRLARRLPRAPFGDASAVVAAVLLLLLPVVGWIGARQSAPSSNPAALPLRVMSYNLHSSFNTDGLQDPEAIARVIEKDGAGIIALQEVSRGWYINASTDLVGWLSQRLKMHVVFKGTTDAMWGNAILSRHPISEWGFGSLPLVDTVMPRGYLWARFEVGGEQPLLVIATHLHHVEAESYVRMAQVPVLLDFWQGAPSTLIIGDLNAEPHYPEMDLIRQAGFIDAWQEAGSGEGLSWPADDPFERIDWIWHTADLVARQAVTGVSTASDHRPLSAVIDWAP